MTPCGRIVTVVTVTTAVVVVGSAKKVEHLGERIVVGEKKWSTESETSPKFSEIRNLSEVPGS